MKDKVFIDTNILIYSKAEYDYMNEQNTLFSREIKNTGKVVYEK